MPTGRLLFNDSWPKDSGVETPTNKTKIITILYIYPMPVDQPAEAPCEHLFKIFTPHSSSFWRPAFAY